MTSFKYFLDSFIFIHSYSHILASIFYITVSFSVGILYYIVLTRLTYFIETRNISIKLLLLLLLILFLLLLLLLLLLVLLLLIIIVIIIIIAIIIIIIIAIIIIIINNNNNYYYYYCYYYYYYNRNIGLNFVFSHHRQVQDIMQQDTGGSGVKDFHVEKRLLGWCSQSLEGYETVPI